MEPVDSGQSFKGGVGGSLESHLRSCLTPLPSPPQKPFVCSFTLTACGLGMLESIDCGCFTEGGQ